MACGGSTSAAAAAVRAGGARAVVKDRVDQAAWGVEGRVGLTVVFGEWAVWFIDVIVGSMGQGFTRLRDVLLNGARDTVGGWRDFEGRI